MCDENYCLINQQLAKLHNDHFGDLLGAPTGRRNSGSQSKVNWAPKLPDACEIDLAFRR